MKPNDNGNQQYDAIIIGGGPAGSTAAAVLAQRGRNVLVLEKDRFPRYHIGESLMPYCYFPLERTGAIDKVKNGTFVTKKYSVQFVRPDGKESAPFYFFQHLKHEAATTFQVVRSEFDKTLLDHAREHGATVMEETPVKELIKDEAGAVVGVVAQDPGGQRHEYRAPITLDATGRDAFTQTREGWRIRDPQLSKISIWTYYKGAKRDCGMDENATTVAYLPSKGWFWYIPLPDDTVSVGVVAERDYLYRDGKDPQRIFQAEIENNAWIKDHLSQGEQVGQYWVTGDYSYRSKHCAVDGLVLIGDAFAFLDPVFSSGVFLALRSGELAADAADAALEAGDTSAQRFNEYGEQMRYGIEAMRKLVYAFYDETFSFGSVIKKNPQVRPALTDCLIGNLFRDFDELFAAVAEFADLPDALDYGRPRTADAAEPGQASRESGMPARSTATATPG